MRDDVVIEDFAFGNGHERNRGVKQGFTGFYTAVPAFKIQPKSQVTTTGPLPLK
jgi:hypothetical protein